MIFVSTFLLMYCLFSSDFLLSLITIVILKWSLNVLTWIVAGYNLLYFIVIILMSEYCTTDRRVYIMSIVCIVAQLIMFVTMIIMKLIGRKIATDSILMFVFVVSWIFPWLLEEVILRSMLSKMVPSHSQSFVEGLRNAVSKISTILASISVAFVLPYLHWWSLLLMVCISFLLVIFVMKRRSLSDIAEIKFWNILILVTLIDDYTIFYFVLNLRPKKK